MTISLEIVGLNMELVNTLIWALTVLAKLTIGATIIAGILWVIVFILGMLFSN